MKTTTDTFWQMILQEECPVAVMLCDCVELREVVLICLSLAIHSVVGYLFSILACITR